MLDIEHAMLAERFEALLEAQRRAESVYAHLAERITDPALREQVEEIGREKHRHVRLTERLLEIVE